MIATDRTGLILPTLFAVFIHEAGHLFAMWAADCAPKRIRLIPAAVEITEDYGRSKGAGVWIVLCGPLANLAVSAALFVNYYLSGAEISLKVALLNLVLALFNLLPVSGLDGGRLLCAALCRKKDLYSAERTVRLVTAAVAALIFFCGVFLIISGNANPSVLIVALYLAVCALIKR
ncbi:MAG: site-2 protease family protein [Clostridia bacterium]|nr:site-2 protease family protein [Clostridia bacterium]